MKASNDEMPERVDLVISGPGINEEVAMELSTLTNAKRMDAIGALAYRLYDVTIDAQIAQEVARVCAALGLGVELLPEGMPHS